MYNRLQTPFLFPLLSMPWQPLSYAVSEFHIYFFRFLTIEIIQYLSFSNLFHLS